jgi:predicted ATPase
MQLYAALGSALVYTKLGPRTRTAWTTALELAEQLGDREYKLRSLWGLWFQGISSGDFQRCLTLASRLKKETEGSDDPVNSMIAERAIGTSLLFLGEQSEAQVHFERMLGRFIVPIQASHMVRFQFDQRATARAYMARILWLLGSPDQARRLASQAVREAEATEHDLSICNALGHACTVALFTGDLAEAECFVETLLRHSRQAPGLWHAWARYFRGAVVSRRGDPVAGLQMIRPMLSEATELLSMPRYLLLFGEAAVCLGSQGETSEALDVINGALDRSSRRHEHWYTAELLRIKGDLILTRNCSDVELAEALFRDSINWAQRQKALSWELRSATSLARLQRDSLRTDDARALLMKAYRRFTEGFETTDLCLAKSLLDEMPPP